MSILYVQILYAICCTLGAAIATATVVGAKYNYKPWNCVYCMTVWFGLIFTLVFCPTTMLTDLIGFWGVSHIVAYIVYNKMS